MENVHDAIAWYQKKIGSYDKQLWEQSVERKLQKQPPFVLHNAPRKKVRLKTEYIDVDLIRGSTFAKTKPQVPWVYVTRKAIARVLFFPFYYNWWVHQTSSKLYAILLVLYILQVVTVIVYLRNVDHSIMEDELSFTEVILPTILMFLLCLIHSQTVLAHISHKPPKRTKSISGVIRKPRPKKTPRKGRSSGNNSTCQEDGGNTDTSTKTHKRHSAELHIPKTISECQTTSLVCEAQAVQNTEPPASPSIDMEENLLSRSVSDYDLKPATNSTQIETQPSPSHHQHHHHLHQRDSPSKSAATGHRSQVQVEHKERCQLNDSGGKEQKKEEGAVKQNWYGVHDSDWGKSRENHHVHKTSCSYSLLDNLPNLLTVEKVCQDVGAQVEHGSENNGQICDGGASIEENDTKCTCPHACSEMKVPTKGISKGDSHVCVKIISHNAHGEIPGSANPEQNCGCVDNGGVCDHFEPSASGFECPNHVDLELGRSATREINSQTRALDRRNKDELGRQQKDGQHERPVLVSDSSSEYPSGSDYPSSSDFEMVDHQVGADKIRDTSSQRDIPSSCAQCAVARAVKHDEGEGELGIECSVFLPASRSESTDHCLRHEGGIAQEDNPISPACAPLTSPVSNSTSGFADLEDVTPVSKENFQILNCLNTETSSKGVSHSGVKEESQVECSCQKNIPSSTQDLSLSNDKGREPIPKCTSSKESKPVDRPSGTERSQNLHQLINGDHQIAGPSSLPHILIRAPSIPHDSNNVISSANSVSAVSQQQAQTPAFDSSSQLQCFSELFVQEILNEDTLREMSCNSLLAHSDLENSSSSISHLSTASASSSSSSTASYKTFSTRHIPSSSQTSSSEQTLQYHQHPNISSRRGFHDKVKVIGARKAEMEKSNSLDESLEQINMSDGERPSDDVSNYNPSDSDAESDGPSEELRNRMEENWKRIRFQEITVGIEDAGQSATPTASNSGGSSPKPGASSIKSGANGAGTRSVVGILTRKPSPLKDLAIGRKTSTNTVVANSSGSDQEQNDGRNQVRRRRRTSGTPGESGETSRTRAVPNSLGLRPQGSKKHLSSSDNETGAHTPEGSNKATMSSEEWEDRMQSDETTSSAYSSSCGNSEVDSDEREEEDGEEKTEYTTSTLHVINLLQPTRNGLLSPDMASNQSYIFPRPKQSGSPSSSGNVSQPDKVSCVIWEGNDCKKVDLTALDIGWAIIDKVDSLPESSDYFLIGLLFSFIMGVVPLIFRAYVNKDLANLEDLMSWTWLISKLSEAPCLLSNTYSWRQYLLMINGILQRFFLSLFFFFLLSVADRTFKQRLHYAKHFSYLTSSRRARKFSMPHFRLNKVRNIKIWLSLRSYLKRRGPQRSVDVIVSACFMCAICTVCLISLQMLKDTESYLDYLCNWELMVWCLALGVFLMRFMTVGLKINKKYRNLSVLITEQINLYLQMEQKPHKKEELILANNVLRLAEDLLKELESPFKISGFSANPLIYNIMRVVVLSAFSAVLTEVLGFKLKLHKIKLKG